MADGQTENKELNPQLPKEKPFAQELQEVLSSTRFQNIANAYRVIDMADKHSENLLKFFPDTKTAIGSIDERPYVRGIKVVGRKSTVEMLPNIHLNEEQAKMLTTEIKGGRDLVKEAWLYTYDERDGFAQGHGIRGTMPPLSLNPAKVSKEELRDGLYSPTLRGLFVKMAGNFDGVNILLLDDGKSRWLYDWANIHGEEDNLVQKIVSDLAFDRYGFGYWMHKEDDSHLIIADHDYNIQQVIPLNGSPTPGVEPRS